MNGQNHIMNPTERIIAAWTNPGVNPEYHFDQIRRLEREWPTLAAAIRALIAEGNKNA